MALVELTPNYGKQHIFSALPTYDQHVNICMKL